MKKYDLILVIEFFRSLTYYLSIIRHLSKEYRIGLYQVAIDESVLVKNRDAQSEFLHACVEFGAELIDDKPVYSDVLLIPQRPYLKEALEDIRHNIHAARKVGALTLAWAGIPIHDAFLTECDLHKVFVIDKHFINFLLDHREGRSTYEGLELVEVGLPFSKYPVFPEFVADYLMAIPTPFSFAHEKDKWFFLETVLSLFDEMDSDDEVVHKPHNAVDRDQLSTLIYRKLVRILRHVPGISSVFRCGALIAPRKLKKHLERLYTAYLYERVLERTVPMKELTPFHNFGMEAFLPGVKKAVIGGLSNTIWGTLFHRIPFYNCVDITQQRRDADDKLYGKKKPEPLLGLNLKFFYVPYCEGQLQFDPKYFDIIDESTRQGDLIEELRKEIQYSP